MNDLGLQFFSNDQAFVCWEMRFHSQALQRGRSGWSQGLQRGAGVWCCNSQCYTCWAWQHILCKCHGGETLGCTSWSKQDCESPRSCVHGNVKWDPRMYQTENSPQRSRDANAIMQCAFVRNAAWQLWSPEVRQDKCRVGGGKAAKEPLNNEQKWVIPAWTSWAGTDLENQHTRKVPGDQTVQNNKKSWASLSSSWLIESAAKAEQRWLFQSVL